MHDLLLSKSGVAAPASHPLRVAVTRHKARLSAELTKVRIKRGFGTIEELRIHLALTEASQSTSNQSLVTKSQKTNQQWPHPRWVRVNTLKTTLDIQLKSTFVEYMKADGLNDVLAATSSTKILCVDEHVPDLLALPAGTDLTTSAAYRNGCIILQNKASCFPAYLLDPQPEHGACLDACAAPGNKTTHIATILRSRCKEGHKARVWACERDSFRAETLTRMVNLAGCQDAVTVKLGQDFLLLDPDKAPWRDVGSLLLDPSCSGSGIVGRDETLAVTLPSQGTNNDLQAKSRKRKRGGHIDGKLITNEKHEKVVEHDELPSTNRDSKLSARLEALSAFQLRLLLHAFRFPSAKRISYSTCSIHAEENEHVVIAALQSPIAKLRNWRLLRRDEQVAGMQSWSFRGDAEACRIAVGEEPMMTDEIAEACIRCQPGTAEGTQGFFVAAFVRDVLREDGHPEMAANGTMSTGDTFGLSVGTERGDEWEGFSDSS